MAPSTPATARRRPSGRAPDELRVVRFTRKFTKHAAGSVLVEFGDTRVICTASVEDRVPPFMRGAGRGWVTAEYGMLPGSTHTRSEREASRGQQNGRTIEIQRLIGRALRTAVDAKAIGERTIRIDCDVIQADGGTRTASITGGCLALYDAVRSLPGVDLQKAWRNWVASVLVGVWSGVPVLDLDYAEDSSADTDMNVVMLDGGGFVEIQGTAEREPFSDAQLAALLALARTGTAQIFQWQRAALGSG